MLVVGVTGGIGSGKSTICKVLEVLGYPVFYADDESKKILFSPSVSAEVAKYFGDHVLTEGKLDKAKLGALVFNDPDALKWLNSLLHPKVAAAFENWIKNQTNKIVFKEAAILFESGGESSCDKVITIGCAEDIRIKRVLKRDPHGLSRVKNVIAKQLTDQERRKRADYEIMNEDQKVFPQIVSILVKLDTISKA